MAEELAKGPADAGFIGPTLAAELRRRTGAPPAEAAETVLLTSDLGRLAFDEPRPVAIDAAGSSTALGVARSDDGWILTATPLVPTGAPVDLTRPSATPAGPATPVPGQQRALTADELGTVHALGRSIAAADLVGTMDGAVRLAIGYVTERRQYGRPVGSFQAVQHLLADAFVFTEGSRSATLHAAWAVDALPPTDAMTAASVAKAYAARSARTVCETVIQVHGGIGNTWECMAHLYLRRALLSIELFGGIQASLTSVLAHHGIEVDDGLRRLA